MILFQLTQLCQKLDILWAENKGSVVMYTWAQFLKEESLAFLGFTDTLDLDNIKPVRQAAGVSSICDQVTANEGPEDSVGATSGSTGEVKCDTGNSLNDSGIVDSSNTETSSLTLSRQNSQNYDSRTIQDIAPKTNMLRLLKDYDEEMRRKVFGTKTFECKVCFIDKLGAHCLEFWPCRHVYCKDCMASYFTVQISEGNIKFLRCPEDECESEANPKQVSNIFSNQLIFSCWYHLL